MTWELASTILAGICALGIFSYLIKENPVYRVFEHMFIGIAAGWAPIQVIKTFLWPKFIVPLFGLDILVYPDGSSSAAYSNWNLLYLAPFIMGLLYYTIFSSRFNWLAKVVIGFSIGASAGLTFKGWFAEMIPQLTSSMKPLISFKDGAFDLYTSFSNFVFVVTLLSVMVYFFFTFKKESKAVSRVSVLGRWLMMICFGAFFGSTVMARMALLVERIQFLIDDWRVALVTVVKSVL